MLSGERAQYDSTTAGRINALVRCASASMELEGRRTQHLQLKQDEVCHTAGPCGMISRISSGHSAMTPGQLI